jgi:hypothetical protein
MSIEISAAYILKLAKQQKANIGWIDCPISILGDSLGISYSRKQEIADAIGLHIDKLRSIEYGFEKWTRKDSSSAPKRIYKKYYQIGEEIRKRAKYKP